MQGKVAVEEHFALPETVGGAARYTSGRYWSDLEHRLLDLGDRRLAEMDRSGIEVAVLSLNSPAVQAIAKPSQAIDTARRINDILGEHVAKRPDRFAGLGALPMQDPDAAARELHRCVRDLGFKGALVNGVSQPNGPSPPRYYDLPEFRPFWSEAEALGAPFYLHPPAGLSSGRPAYDGHSWLIGSPWSFAEETALHALRLMGSGLFDAHPKLQIVLGHLGERIPYDLWRLDNRLGNVPDRPARHSMTHYFRSNFYITTSGQFFTPTLLQAISTIGADRVLFAVDYPFEDNEHAAAWFDDTDLSDADRARIGRLNAIKLFQLA
jgi:2,3-dihydroxybenzoate decarboxylase